MVTKKISKSQLGICYWFFCVFTVLSLAGIAAWQSLIPKNPSFAISYIRFPTNIKNQSSHHNPAVTLPSNSTIFHVEIFNPNKRMGIYYNAIILELYGGGRVVVGANSTPAFYQGYKNTTTMVQIPVHAGREFWQGVNGGDASFKVRIETDVKFWVIKWKTRVRRVVYEARFTKGKVNLNGTVLGRNYAEMQNGSKVRIGY